MTTNPPTPNDLIAIEESLCELAVHDRRSAPAGLEDRVVAASRGALACNVPSVEPPAVVARIGPTPGGWASPMRMAAAIALLATVATLWLAIDTGPASPEQSATLAAGVELTLDDWNEVESLLDDGLGDRLDTLYAETALVADESDEADWRAFELSLNGESL